MITFNYSKTMSNIFQMKKHLILVGYPYRSKFESQNKNHEVKICGKNCVSSHYLLKASLYQFKRVKKPLLMKNSFNCESSNLIFVIIYQGCKEEYIGETSCLAKERINIYRQHIRQVKYQQLAVKEHLLTCGDRKSHMFPFSRIFKKINR